MLTVGLQYASFLHSNHFYCMFIKICFSDHNLDIFDVHQQNIAVKLPQLNPVGKTPMKPAFYLSKITVHL